jgi:hypothetical protein
VIPWWYVGGAVFTLVLTVLLSDVVSLPAAGAAVLAPYIFIEIMQRRAHTARRDSDRLEQRTGKTAAKKREPIAAGLILSVVLGAGLIVGFRQSEPPNWTAAIVGLVMVGIPLIVIVVVLVRSRGASPA